MTAKSLRHKFQSAKIDSADTTIVRPSPWNDDHNFFLGVNVQSGASYALADTDAWTEVVFTAATTAIAVTIAQAATGGQFLTGWKCRIRHAGSSFRLLTLTPTVSKVNGLNSLVLLPGQYADVYSDGTNYAAVVGEGQSGINVLRNTKFDHFRRGLTGTASSAAATGPDGWYLAASGTALTWQQNVTAGGNLNSNSGLQVNGAAGNTDFWMYQRIESFLASQLCNRLVTLQMVCALTGVGGSSIPQVQFGRPTTQTGPDVWTGGTTWDFTGVNLQDAGAAAGYLLLGYSWVASGNLDNGAILLVDFGTGLSAAGRTLYVVAASLSVGGPSVIRHRDPASEIDICERYLPGYVAPTTPVANRMLAPGQIWANNQGIHQFPMLVKPRAPLTGIVLSAPGDFAITNTTGGMVACTAMNFGGGANGSASDRGFEIDTVVASGAPPVGNPSFLYSTTGTARLLLTGAEL